MSLCSPNRRDRLRASLKALLRNDSLDVELFQAGKPWPLTSAEELHSRPATPQSNAELSVGDDFVVGEPSDEDYLSIDPLMLARQWLPAGNANHQFDTMLEPSIASSASSLDGAAESDRRHSNAYSPRERVYRPRDSTGAASEVLSHNELCAPEYAIPGTLVPTNGALEARRAMSFCLSDPRLHNQGYAVHNNDYLQFAPMHSAHATPRPGSSNPLAAQNLLATAQPSSQQITRGVKRKASAQSDTVNARTAASSSPSIDFISPDWTQPEQAQPMLVDRHGEPVGDRPPKRQRPHYNIEKRYRAGLKERFEALRECVELRKKLETRHEAGYNPQTPQSNPQTPPRGEGSTDRSTRFDSDDAPTQSKLNKADVLSEAVLYIQDLREENEVIMEHLKLLVNRQRAARAALGAS